jgi:hypothetical protein
MAMFGFPLTSIVLRNRRIFALGLFGVDAPTGCLRPIYTYSTGTLLISNAVGMKVVDVDGY